MALSNYSQYEVLHRPFDIETHKKTFINYCEVVILEDGTIEYAVPSHEQKLLEVVAKKHGMTKQEIIDKVRDSNLLQYWYEILSHDAKCMQVSNSSCRFFFKANDAQIKSLQTLIANGLIDIMTFNDIDANERTYETLKALNPSFNEIIHFFDK